MTTAQLLTYRTLADTGPQGAKSKAIRELCEEVDRLQKRKKTSGPTLEEVNAYAVEIGLNGGEPERMWDHYEMVGWVYGKGRTPIKSWRAALRKWKANETKFNGSPGDGKKERYY